MKQGTQNITSSTWQRRRSIWLGVALLAGALTGSAPVPAGAKCALGERVALRNPVVTVLAGPGDLAVEQERWSSLRSGVLDSDLLITLGETFSYEAVP